MTMQRCSLQFMGGLALGAMVGAGLALIFAPRSGQDMRNLIMEQMKTLQEETKDRVAELEHQAGDKFHAWEDLGKETFEKQKQAFMDAVKPQTEVLPRD
ncbi:MAG TPA: YtxH domain-containing protein [Anaerolineae bacterium]|nr:YtxH domain-containing protein [Anaerolineae bacterium]MCB0226152.1 YtxH domain-containing protein [Anaerolineae bacterium]HRV91635.1 YtxH domain-containing protein [Anaerolineae bacterium]